MWKDVCSGNIVRGKYYLTCVISSGKTNCVQKMCFKLGLWWTEDGTYTYFTPTHYKEV